METHSAEADCVQPARETASASGTGSTTTALCLVTAIAGWPPWMVVVVGTGRRHGAGTLAGVEPAMRGPALEAPMESVPSTVVPRAEPQMTPPNAATEKRHLHVGVPRNDVLQGNIWDSCRGHDVCPEGDSREAP